MRRCHAVPAFVIALVSLSVLTTLVAPVRARALGLDFWNYSSECAQVRDQFDRGRDLDHEKQNARKLDALCEQIALRFCDGDTSLDGALDELTALAECAPGWWNGLRGVYRDHVVSASASDREVAAQLLRKRTESFLARAKRSGDQDRELRVVARLASIDEQTQAENEVRTIARAKP